MQKMLITGGQGDLAQAIAKRYQNEYELLLPSSKELDVTDKLQVKAYLSDKNIDVLINNAGTIHPKRILESDEDLWEQDIQVNLIGPYRVAKKVLERNPKAIIINISSTAAFNAYPDWSSYCSSKAGLMTFTKCLANDGFESYCLCPGAILTKFRDGLDLNNDNAMSTEQFLHVAENVINGIYESGDVMYFRKNELIVNP